MGNVGTTYVHNIIRTHIYVHRRYRGAGDGALVGGSSGAGCVGRAGGEEAG